MIESSNKLRLVKITRDGRSCIMTKDMAIEEAITHFSESEIGESFVWENISMSQEEFSNLHEFSGW